MSAPRTAAALKNTIVRKIGQRARAGQVVASVLMELVPRADATLWMEGVLTLVAITRGHFNFRRGGRVVLATCRSRATRHPRSLIIKRIVPWPVSLPRSVSENLGGSVMVVPAPISFGTPREPRWISRWREGDRLYDDPGTGDPGYGTRADWLRVYFPGARRGTSVREHVDLTFLVDPTGDGDP